MLLYSFDVFDTTITRDTATPTGIFALMQERLLTDAIYQGVDGYIRRNFYVLRQQAEALARYTFQGDGIEDISLEQIYEAMSMTGTVSAEDQRLLADLERETELLHIQGIRKNIERILQLRSENFRVIFISDMYLDAATIKKLLLKAEPALEGIPVYVSSECKKVKRTGNLYRFVKERERAEFDGWIHRGDNEKTDVEVPGAMGICAQRYFYEGLLPWEKNLTDDQADNAFYQLTIGASRNARLKRLQYGAAYAIGSSVGGGILFPYLWWVLKESKRKGIRRLFFIARDGYILKRMADQILEKCDLGIETSYLYGSREAWRMPAFISGNLPMKQLVAWSHPSRLCSLDLLAQAVGLSEQEVSGILGLQEEKRIEPLTPLGLYNAVLLLSQSRSYWMLIRRKYGEKRRRVLSYLTQEIGESLKDVAFVEVSGSGFTQCCLADILSENRMQPIRTFYFKMDKVVSFKNCIFYNYFPGRWKSPMLIELLTRASHGQTTDYESLKGRMQPVLKQGEGEALESYGLSDYVDGVTDFTEEYVRAVKDYGVWADDLALLMKYVEEMQNEDRQELLDFFGDMPDSMLGWEKVPVIFGPRLTREEITELKKKGQRQFLSKFRGSCLEYSLLRCTKEEKALLQQEDRILPDQLRQTSCRYYATQSFPLELLGERIVLYGAGKAGVDLYNRIRRETDSKVVLWVDNNWQNCKTIDAINIFPVESIKEENYDQIIITLLDKKTAGRIKRELMETGICGERILVIDYQIRWQDVDRPWQADGRPGLNS